MLDVPSASKLYASISLKANMVCLAELKITLDVSLVKHSQLS